MKVKRAVFLDRDGVVNLKMPEGEYVTSWSRFKFLSGSLEGIKILHEHGYIIIVVTNQRGIALGLMSEDDLAKIHLQMLDAVREAGGELNKIFYCKHDKIDNCGCRKPKPGMILRAIEELRSAGVDIDIEKSFLLGDSERDIIAGRSVGLTTYSIGDRLPGSDRHANSLLEAAKHITSYQA